MIQCYQYTPVNESMPIRFYVIQAYDEAICISVNSATGSRTIYEDMTVEILDQSVPAVFKKQDCQVAYFLTLHMSVKGRITSILKKVNDRVT